LAGRGAELNAAIHRANPALEETDKVLAILAAQNRTLANLARDSDTVLAPLARDRRKVADAIANSNRVAAATAARRGDLEADIERLPPFLTQLKPTMIRLGALSDEMSPVLEDLGAQAPAINRFIISLGPFSKSATPSLVTLGDASVPGRKALVAAKPIAGDLKTFGQQVKPLSTNLSALLTSLRDTGGIERLMDYLFYQVAAINGFDSYGHYLRAQLIVNICSTYAIENSPTCTANFSSGSSARAASAPSEAGRSTRLAREDRVLRGESVADVLAGGRSSTRSKHSAKTGSGNAIALPPALLPGDSAGAGSSSSGGSTSTSSRRGCRCATRHASRRSSATCSRRTRGRSRTPGSRRSSGTSST
jgi:hypothetical protein